MGCLRLRQCGKIYASLRTLKMKTHFLRPATKLLLFKSLIYPHFISCDFVIPQASAYAIGRLKVALNCCVRFIYNINRFSHVSHLQHTLLGCSLINFGKLRAVNLIFNLLKKQSPSYLLDILTPLRTQRGRKFSIYRCRTSHYSDSFFVRGVAYWNQLPHDLQTVTSIVKFKRICAEHFR